MGFLKKVLKVVAIAAAVALTISTGGAGGSVLAVFLGVSQVAATAIVAGLTIASSLLNKPKVPSVSNATLSRLSVSIDPRTPRKIVFGDTAMAADLRDYEYTGTDDEYVHYFIVNASHRITAHDEIWFDDKLAWTSAGGVQGEFVGYLTVATRTEGNAANAINISPRMGLTRRFTGLAYTHLRFKRTGNTKKAESPFAQSIPQRITTIGRGIPCYDPRLDSTVTGGSGSHRVDDQSTWAFTRNPALQLLTYLLGWRINDKLAVGKGMPVARLDLPSFMAAANACDEPVALAAGGTEPRYRSDGIFSEADDMGLVIDAFKTTMNAELDDSDGKLAIRVLLNDLDDPIADFGPDDFLSGLTWSPVADISDRFNVVRGQYTDARNESLYQMVDYPEVLLASVDGIERSHNLPLPLVQSPSQAQRLAKQVLQRQQYSGTLEVTLGHTGWRVQKYDIVAITHPPLGFAAKLFRVASIGVGTHGQVQVTLREENAAIYAWDEDERPPVEPAGLSSYNYTNDPLLQAVDGASAFPRHEPSSAAINFTANAAGELDPPDQVPETLLVQRFAGTVDVTADAGTVWSIDYVDGLTGGAVTVSNGLVTIPAGIVLSPGYALIRIKSVREGLTLFTNLTLTQSMAAPSAGNSTSNFASVSDDTLIVATPTMRVTTGPTGQIDFSGVLSITGEKDDPEGSYGAVARWQYRLASGGSWTWAGAAIDDISPLVITYVNDPDLGPRFVREVGQINTARSVTGLSASTDYEFELWLSRDSTFPVRTISFGGTVSGVGV
jgi:hypothetical protein